MEIVKVTGIEKVKFQQLAGSDPGEMFNAGKGFYLAGKRALWGIKTDSGQLEWLPLPGVVNLALSVELFLKALLASRGKADIKEHNLEVLLSETEKVDRDAIHDYYSGEIVKVSSSSIRDFDALVGDIKLVFKEGRYYYEGASCEFIIEPMGIFAEGVRRRVESVLAASSSS